MTSQCHVRFNISNTVYNTSFTLRKFNFELKLRKTEKRFAVGNWKHEILIGRGDG